MICALCICVSIGNHSRISAISVRVSAHEHAGVAYRTATETCGPARASPHVSTRFTSYHSPVVPTDPPMGRITSTCPFVTNARRREKMAVLTSCPSLLLWALLFGALPRALLLLSPFPLLSCLLILHRFRRLLRRGVILRRRRRCCILRRRGGRKQGAAARCGRHLLLGLSLRMHVLAVFGAGDLGLFAGVVCGGAGVGGGGAGGVGDGGTTATNSSPKASFEAPRLRLNASLACSGPAVRLHAARQSRAMSWAVSRARSVRRPPAPMPALRRIRRSC